MLYIYTYKAANAVDGGFISGKCGAECQNTRFIQFLYLPGISGIKSGLKCAIQNYHAYIII